MRTGPSVHLWFELTNRRKDEKTISYAESHDQALVGDQTLIFRLIGEDMYYHMGIDDDNFKGCPWNSVAQDDPFDNPCHRQTADI